MKIWSQFYTSPTNSCVKKEKEAVMVSTGATFTVVATNENVIYFWGTRFISPISRSVVFVQILLELRQFSYKTY